ncbi:hypothetical protein D3C81_1414010 [compost metagenome]
MAQRHRAEIQEQLARQFEAAPGGQGGARRLDFQRDGVLHALRQAEQGFRQCVRRAGRATDQRFVADQLGIAGLHDRLEHRMQRRNLRAWHRRPGRCAWQEVERWQCGVVAGHEWIREAKLIGRAQDPEAGHIA